MQGLVFGTVHGVIHALHARGEQAEGAPEEGAPALVHPVAEQALTGEACPAELEEYAEAVALEAERAPRQRRPLEPHTTAPRSNAMIDLPPGMRLIAIGFGEAPLPVRQEVLRQPLTLGRACRLLVRHAVHEDVVEAGTVVRPAERLERGFVIRPVGRGGEERKVPAGLELEDIPPAHVCTVGKAQLGQQPARRLMQVGWETGDYRLVGGVDHCIHWETIST